MKLVINSTDFSTIGTALYFSNSSDNAKFLPSWIISDEEIGTGFEYLGDLKMINDLENPILFQNKYFSVDNLRYFAYPSPELFVTNGQKTVDTPLNNPSVYYCGNKERLLDGDFAEYDFSFLVDKYKFNNNLKIQYLDKESQDILGYDVSELTEMEKILFPTAYETFDTNYLLTAGGTRINTGGGNRLLWREPESVAPEVIYRRNYFGMVTIGTYTLFVFTVPPYVRKIELYEGTVLGSDLSLINTNYDYRIRDYSKYDPEKTYSRDNIVVYSGSTWKALVDGITGDWDATKWKFVNKFIQPSLSIYLGPDYLWSLCPSDWYQADPSSWGSAIRYLPTSKKYLKGMDEITSEKILWMVITDSGQLLDINLSYNSWSTDKVNPERNKWKYSLRNDEFWSTKDNMSLLKDKSGILLDGRSNTILSTEKVETHPILSRKMKKFDLNYYDEDRSYITGEKVRYLGKLWKALQNVPAGEVPEEGSVYWTTLEQVYSPYCTYRLGERVLFNGEVWESLCDLNLGNRPDCSRQWIPRNSTTNFFTTRVNVIVNPSGAGRITPGGQIRIEGEKVFSVYETLGYELESVNRACSSETGSYLSDVSIETDSVAVEGGIMDRKKVRIGSTSVEPILDSGKLIFNFKATPTIITINGMYGDNLYQYSAWNFNNERIKLTSTPSETVSNTLSINPGTTLILSPSTTLVNNKFTKVMSTYTDRYGVTRVKQLSLSGNTVEDFIDFSSATYTFYIEKNEVVIDCTIGLSEFEMEDNRIEVDYNENGYFRFYPRASQGSRDILVAINDTDTIKIKPNQRREYSRTGTPRTIPGVCRNYELTPVSGYYELRFDNLISDVNIELSYDN